jgi:hypothetical protein
LRSNCEAMLVRLTAPLNALKRRGEPVFDDIDLPSRMVDAVICKVALMLPEAEDPKALRERGQKIIGSMLGLFRRAPTWAALRCRRQPVFGALQRWQSSRKRRTPNAA